MHFSIFLFFFLSINQFVFEDQGYIFNDLFSICLICVLKIAKLNWLNAWKFNPLTKFYWRFHMKNEWWKSKSATSHALQVEMNSILIYLNNVQAFEMTQLKCIYIVNSRRIRISWKKKKKRNDLVKNVEYIIERNGVVFVCVLWCGKTKTMWMETGTGPGIGIKIAILNLSSISIICVIYTGMPFKSRHKIHSSFS